MFGGVEGADRLGDGLREFREDLVWCWSGRRAGEGEPEVQVGPFAEEVVRDFGSGGDEGGESVGLVWTDGGGGEGGATAEATGVEEGPDVAKTAGGPPLGELVQQRGLVDIGALGDHPPGLSGQRQILEQAHQATVRLGHARGQVIGIAADGHGPPTLGTKAIISVVSGS